MRLKLHWQILIAMVVAVALGAWLQSLESRGWLGLTVKPLPETWSDPQEGLRITGVARGGPASTAGLRKDDVLISANGTRFANPDDLAAWEKGLKTSERVRVEISRRGPMGRSVETKTVIVGNHPSSTRARWLAPFVFIGAIFLRCLQMLIVPLIVTSIVSGVAGVGANTRIGRLFGKTFVYYLTTSLLAILTGFLLVNLIRPGADPTLPLSDIPDSIEVSDEKITDIFIRMIPANPVEALSTGNMLQIIFFSLLFGFFLTRIPASLGDPLTRFFQAAFAVMMEIAGFVLRLIPLGVLALITKIIGETGFGVFAPLGKYMLTVVLGLLIHSTITLPILLRTIGKIRPLHYARAMLPALFTAFSTSSSSVTLPVTLETVEKRGGVSNRVSSFVLPLGSTINMDGTALYECVGVIFLAQFYSVTAGFELTVTNQVTVILLALLASIGAAGIPSAGLVLMLTILSALKLPLEGAILILAVDRPLDMLRTVVNIWSDSCGAAIVAKSEGEFQSQSGLP